MERDLSGAWDFLGGVFLWAMVGVVAMILFIPVFVGMLKNARRMEDRRWYRRENDEK